MWAQGIGVVLGIWLMAAPAVLGYGGPLATSDRIAGPLAAAAAATAAWGVTRSVRWVNLPIGLWVVAAPWLLGGPWAGVGNGLVVGLLLAGLSTVRGRVAERFGGGWSALWSGQS